MKKKIIFVFAVVTSLIIWETTMFALAFNESSKSVELYQLNQVSLEEQINNAPDNILTVIEVDADIEVERILKIPEAKKIELRSKTNLQKLSATEALEANQTGGGVLITVDGELTLTNIELNGENYKVGGIKTNGKLTINDGVTIKQCKSGGIASEGGNIIMTGGIIENNQAYSGAGVYLSDETTFTMKNGTIQKNSAENYGGGVSVYNGSEFIMENGNIIDNVSTDSAGGGGVHVAHGSRFIMKDGFISRNQTTHETSSGGGVMIGVLTYTNPGPEPSTFEMQGGEISYNKMPETLHNGGGGIALVGNGSVNIKGGKIIYNETNYTGGGIFVGSAVPGKSVKLTISGGEIAHNQSKLGGGILLESSYSSLEMSGGEVSNNYSSIHGGGIYLHGGATMNATAGKVSKNTATFNGGGIYITNDSAATLKNVIVDENFGILGGGIYVEEDADLKALSAVKIHSNTANNEGGGIYTEKFIDYDYLVETDYQNMLLGADTSFQKNKANQAYEPPKIAPTYKNIQFKDTTFTNSDIIKVNHPINNYDINYVGVEEDVFYVVYHANGGVGDNYGEKLLNHELHTVLHNDHENLKYYREGYNFIGWGKFPTSEVEDFAVNAQLGVDDSIDNVINLYAIWEEQEAIEIPSDPEDNHEVPTSPEVEKEIIDTNDSTEQYFLIKYLILSIAIVLIMSYKKKQRNGI